MVVLNTYRLFCCFPYVFAKKETLHFFYILYIPICRVWLLLRLLPKPSTQAPPPSQSGRHTPNYSTLFYFHRWAVSWTFVFISFVSYLVLSFVRGRLRIVVHNNVFHFFFFFIVSTGVGSTSLAHSRARTKNDTNNHHVMIRHIKHDCFEKTYIQQCTQIIIIIKWYKLSWIENGEMVKFIVHGWVIQRQFLSVYLSLFIACLVCPPNYRWCTSNIWMFELS